MNVKVKLLPTDLEMFLNHVCTNSYKNKIKNQIHDSVNNIDQMRNHS